MSAAWIAIGAFDGGDVAPDPLEHLCAQPQPAPLGRERLEQPAPVLLPAAWHAEGEVRKDDRREAVRVELVELDPALQPQATQDRRDPAAGRAVADVVQADVELVGALAPEHVAAAADGVVLLEHQRPHPVRRQIRSSRQATQARADHDRIPVSHVQPPPVSPRTYRLA
jgi:hypothetical protein